MQYHDKKIIDSKESTWQTINQSINLNESFIGWIHDNNNTIIRYTINSSPSSSWWAGGQIRCPIAAARFSPASFLRSLWACARTQWTCPPSSVSNRWALSIFVWAYLRSRVCTISIVTCFSLFLSNKIIYWYPTPFQRVPYVSLPPSFSSPPPYYHTAQSSCFFNC